MLRELPTLSKPLAACLLAVFDTHQVTEQNARAAIGRGQRSGPGREWRWLPYAPGWILQRLAGPQAELRFRRLEELKLVELSAVEYAHFGEFLHVRLTRQGRALARSIRGIHRERWPAGRLRECEWAALVVAWHAREEGLLAGGRGKPGGIAWRTWLRLQDHKPAALIKTLRGPEPFSLYRLCLTDYGRAFYYERWLHYHDLYPAVEAPAP